MFWKKEQPTKGRVIGYWVTTGLLAAVMLLGGIMDVTQNKEIVKAFTHLGYPLYFAVLLGVAKILGAIAILVPKFPRLKEWAYAGITIDLIAAAISHSAVGDDFGKIIVPVVFLVILTVSYLLRPPSRVLIVSSEQ